MCRGNIIEGIFMSIIDHYIHVHSIYKHAGRFVSVVSFEHVINHVRHNRIKAEVIGQWLYCFTTSSIGVKLQALGFWYSFKHCAYVYSGREKDGSANEETLDEIRSRLGSRIVTGK